MKIKDILLSLTINQHILTGYFLNQNELCGQTHVSLILQESEFSSNLLSPARGTITHDSICHFSIIFSTYEYPVKMC
jgi:hypothetical protein